MTVSASMTALLPTRDLRINLMIFSPIQREVWQKWNGTGLPDQNTPVSYADVWSRLVARQVMNAIPGSATWSGLLQNSGLTSGSQPLPILLATGRTLQDGSNDYIPDGTVYEMTPYEFGSWDPINTGAFISMKELGTTFLKGYAPQGICISGFDNAA